MISRTTKKFRKLYEALPKDLKQQSKETYFKFKKDPYYPSLCFKQIHSTKPIFSVRISLDYRALGLLKNNAIVWFWIGTHEEYNKLVKAK